MRGGHFTGGYKLALYVEDLLKCILKKNPIRYSMAKSIPIYHITHLSNLHGVVEDNFIWCDRVIRNKRPGHMNVGYQHIKERRLKHRVHVSQKGSLGDYVPFNFCFRSVMLYVLYKGHGGYVGGQDEILHLVSSTFRIVETGQPFCWTDRHADLGYANQYEDLHEMEHKLDLSVMPLKKWDNDGVKEKRQAEFLVHEKCPWSAIEQVVVKTSDLAKKVESVIRNSIHQPHVLADNNWYY